MLVAYIICCFLKLKKYFVGFTAQNCIYNRTSSFLELHIGAGLRAKKR